MSSRSNALFSHLLEDLGYVSNEPNVFSTPREFAKSYLLQSVLKKYTDNISAEADDRALSKFMAVNESCRQWELTCNSWEDELVGEVKNQVEKFWNVNGYPLVSSYGKIFDLSRTGPGASVLALGNDFYSKLFSGPLSCTSSHLYMVYRRCIEQSKTWADAEEFRRAHKGDYRAVEGSRMSFVPKNNDISRVICTEPLLNMFFQLGLGAHLEQRLKSRFGVDLSRQPTVNRELARRGSFDIGTESPVTIDLSSASDSMSMAMLRWLLPHDFMGWLCQFRSPVTEIRGVVHELHMVSSMGNGFTFPLQTTIFSCVVSAVAACHRYRLKQAVFDGTKLVDPGNWSVFGDDIVVPRRLARDVIRVLNILGFSVNTQKTFVEGPFRESCGRDFLNGHDVRPVFIKRLDTRQDRYVAINLLNEWTARTGVPLPKTVQWLLSTIKRVNYVPFDENNDAGVRVPANCLDKFEYNGNLSAIYRADVPVPVQIKVLDSRLLLPGIMSGRRSKYIFNPDGLVCTFLRGDVDNYKITVRHDRVYYRERRKSTHSWDRFPPSGDLKSPFSWRQWNTAVYLNLFG